VVQEFNYFDFNQYKANGNTLNKSLRLLKDVSIEVNSKLITLKNLELES